MARTKTTPRPPRDTIMEVVQQAKHTPTHQYIIDAVAAEEGNTHPNTIKLIGRGIECMVEDGSLEKRGNGYYETSKNKKQKTEEWKPLPPDEKHRSEQPGKISEGFPEQYRSIIENSDKRSFWKFAFHLQELVLLYRELGDHDKGDGFLKALHNMLDLSNHNYEDHNKDKHGNYIGMGHEEMGRDMSFYHVEKFRDIYCVGASTVKLLSEWIETGTMERLEDLRKEATHSISERVWYTLYGLEFDYTPDFLEALGNLADLYKEKEEHRATAFRRAIIALEGQIITTVEDIETKKLIDLKGVGKATLEMFKEYIETAKIQKSSASWKDEFIITGKIKRLEEMCRQKEEEKERRYQIGRRFFLLADTDVRKAVTQLPKDIKLTIDGEGKLLLHDGDRDQYIGRGCPFTFEYEGDTYEVDGKAETNDYGGIPQGLTFEGTLTKNGKQSCKISMEDDVQRSDIVEHNVSTGGDFEKLGFVDGSEEEQAFIEQLKEELEENVVGAYPWESGHE